MKSTRKFSKIISVSLAMTMSASMLSVLPAFAVESDTANFVYDNYCVSYDVTDSWGNTKVVSVTLTNTGDEAIENWMMYFNPNGEIQYINNAEQKTTLNGITYFKNSGYNADIAPSTSVSFTYAVKDCEVVPTDFILCQTQKTVESDYTVSLQVNGSWGENNEYFNGNIIIQNNSEEPIEDWELTFDTNFTITEITGSWSGTMTALEPYSYMLKGSYTNVIAPNTSVNLGFSGIRNGTSEIVDYSMTEISANEELINFLYLSNFENWEDMLDTDDDGLPDKFEIFIGTIPDNQDSDGDNLPDRYEVMTLGSDPTDEHSLDSIFSDGDYDNDSDGLSNYNEYLLETNPLNIDSDYDNLSDGDEVNIYNTNPTNPDTDSDTLSDGDEVDLGLNPLVPDSDENGIYDNEEKFNQSFRYIESDIDAPIKSVGVSFEGTGYINSNTEIVSADTDIYASNLVGIIGEPFSFESTSDFESANISFEIDTDALGIDTLSELGIVWYDKDFQQFRLLESSYNDNTDIITAEVPHFSIYCIINRREWLESQTGYYFKASDDTADLDDDEMPDCYESSNKENPENLFRLSNGTTYFSLIGNKDSDNDSLADGEEIVLCTIGDIDRNGIIETIDVKLLQNHLDGLCELSDIALTIADCNCDGKIDKKDIDFLNKYLNNESITVLSGKGDINGDGVVTIADALILRNFILGISETYQITLDNADFNDDKRIDSFDFVLMRQLIVQGDVSLVGYNYFYCVSDPMNSDTDSDLDLDNADPDPMDYQLNGYFAQKIGELQIKAREYLGTEYNYDNSDKYGGKKDIWLVSYYIRQFKKTYKNKYWNEWAGSDDEFVNFVNSTSTLDDYFGSTDEKGDKYINFNAEGQPLDLYHCYATVSYCFYNQSDESRLAKNFMGWGGDLVSFLDEAYGLTDKNDEYKDLEYICTDLLKRQSGTFKNKSKYFSLEDFFADIDSVNLEISIINSNDSIEKIINTYYSKLNDIRYCDFISTTNMSFNTTLLTLYNFGSLYTYSLGNSYNYNDTDYTKCATAFINFLEDEFNIKIN